MSAVPQIGGKPVRTIAFTPPPKLWDITYTDCFSINTLHNPEDVEEIVSEVAEETADAEVEYRPSTGHLFTSDQMVVELLNEKLYGREIAFVRMHFPNPHPNEF
jgi:hypothetical protein